MVVLWGEHTRGALRVLGKRKRPRGLSILERRAFGFATSRGRCKLRRHWGSYTLSLRGAVGQMF